MSAPGQTPTMNEDNQTLPGPGSLLRAARESAGVSLRDISAQLHLDERTIDALERDDFETLPAPTFVRGYLRGYARLLSVPVGPVMEAYDREDFRPPDLVADIAEEPESNATDFPISLVTWAVVLILGAMVIVWWNNNTQEFGELFEPLTMEGTAQRDISDVGNSGFTSRSEDSPTMPGQALAANERAPLTDDAAAPAPSQTSMSQQEAAASDSTLSTPADARNGQLPASSVAAPDSTALRDTALQADEVLTQARDALAQSRQITQSSSVPSGAPPQNSVNTTNRTPAGPAQTVAGTTAASQVEQAVAQNPPTGDAAQAQRSEGNTTQQPSTATQAHLQLTFTEEAWVEVYGRDGNKLFYDLAKPGETADLRDPGPLRVLLGRTRGVEVRFNDKPFDVTPFVEKGVARFTLP